MQRPLKGKLVYSSSVCLLSVTFVSLMVVYFLLRCFYLTRERYRVTPLARSLAAGGNRPCYGDEEDEEDGEDKTGEGFWVSELEPPALERPAGHGPSEWPAWQTGEALRWPSVPVTASGSSRGIHGFTPEMALGVEASAQKIYAAQSGNVDPLEYSFAQEIPGSGSVRLLGLHNKGAFEERSQGGGSGIGTRSKLRAGETLQMWERRNLPPYAEQQVAVLFHRMTRAASLCRSMLRILTQSQRLRVAREVVRLLALELGAFSLVQERLEPLRSKLGGVLLQLSNEALQRSGQDPSLEEHRRSVRNLAAVVGELARPRMAVERNLAYSYRIKMLSLLRAATEVIGFCISVLEGLAKFEAYNKRKPSSDLVLQQVRVLWRLYEVHSSYIARDSTVRQFILECQKNVGIQPILCHRHAEIAAEGLPPVKQLVEELRQAVRDAGGLLQTRSHATRKHVTFIPTRSASGQPTPALQEPMSEERRQTQQPARFVSSFQPSPVSAGMELQNLQTRAAGGPLSHLPVAHARVGHRLAPTIPIQPPYAPGNAHRRVELVPSQFSRWGYRTLEGDSPQQEEEEEVEEVEGLLGELIKGGLNPQDIFPWRKHTDA
ncbi:hypothetical protein EPH_0020580 [Eimeria praecox]|uniref:Uncharacterized protein n=1 Tax=Eimeria praecox TaxID=51316 RepID=U6H3Z2_9EIME|nr:hypothetical protein EPH_0020580 [Eimeria praecox]